MASAKNRILEILSSNVLNGIDYVEVRLDEQTRLYVRFFNGVDVHQPGMTAIISGGDLLPTVAVEPIHAGDWSLDSKGRQVLTLRVAGRGDFSIYTLRLQGAASLDPLYQQVPFSFFAFCPSLLDCKPGEVYCPEPESQNPRIDYLAKDYESFRQALSEFSSERYPKWRERSEVDFGMVMLEMLSAIGDDLSYLQDRIHNEAAISTATERRSLVHLARLVDYEPKPVTSAQTILQCKVDAFLLPAGIQVSAQGAGGEEVVFEIGEGLLDQNLYPVNPAWNQIEPYWWDDEECCLEMGATLMYLRGHDYGFSSGVMLLIDTQGETTADPPKRQIVRLLEAGELEDPLYGQLVTRIRWREEDALSNHHDLRRTLVSGNLVPATQGERQVEFFSIHQAPAHAPDAALAVARLGPNSSAAKPNWQYRYTLGRQPLAYLPEPDSDKLAPEIELTLMDALPSKWTWVKSMLEAGPSERKYTLEPESWRTILTTDQGSVLGYDGAEGTSVRFGDGDFGELPNDGDFYQVRYRTGLGAAGNVTADSIVSVDQAWRGTLLEASNPFPAAGGADAETDDQIRSRAPQAFRAKTYRAVRTEDYEEAAEQLSWVQRAGTVFRWTGSWNTIFTAADPLNAGEIDPEQHKDLVRRLNRYRLAGYECYAPPPAYVSFDLIITVCAESGAYRGEVLAGVNKALSPRQQAAGTVGFFHYNNFSLGTPFNRSRLDAAIQRVPGVDGVLSVQYRRRGRFIDFREMPEQVGFAPGEIFRLDNDPNWPERGSYRLRVKGGK